MNTFLNFQKINIPVINQQRLKIFFPFFKKQSPSPLILSMLVFQHLLSILHWDKSQMSTDLRWRRPVRNISDLVFQITENNKYIFVLKGTSDTYAIDKTIFFVHILFDSGRKLLSHHDNIHIPTNVWIDYIIGIKFFEYDILFSNIWRGICY